MKRYTIPLFLLFLCNGCKQSATPVSPVDPAYQAAAYRVIDSAKPLIQSGDVIFRNGNDDVSRAARSMNRKDTSFSHCGLIQIEHDSIFVYHAIGGIYNPDQRLRRDPIDSFCTPAENNAFGIYRYKLSPEQEATLGAVVRSQYKAGLKFDLYFNFFSDDVMYCSEFVFKSLNRSVKGAYTKYIRLDTIPYGVTTDDIYLNENCRLIKRGNFNQ